MSAARDARSLEQLLDDLAAATPAPGGCCAAAWTCALAASLVEMTAAFATGRSDLAERHTRMEQIRARARKLRGRGLELGERELQSYEPVLEALRLPKGDPERAARLDSALAVAGPGGSSFEP